MVDYLIEQQSRDRLVLKFKGELESDDINELKDILAKTLTTDYVMILNMEDVKKIDNDCLQLLCRAHRISYKTDKSLMLCGIKPEIIEQSVKDAGHTRHTVCDSYGEDGCVWSGGCLKCE